MRVKIMEKFAWFSVKIIKGAVRLLIMVLINNMDA